MRNIIFYLFLLAILMPTFSIAQQTTAQDSLLDHMVGKWELRGTIGGEKTIHDVDINWVLAHQYIQIKEVSQEKDVNGKPLYEAIVYICWEQKLNEFSCLWLDNTGNGGLSAQAVGHAKANGNKIELLFKFGDNSTFHTTFIYDKNTDSWQWQMDAEENNKLQPFARVNLVKK